MSHEDRCVCCGAIIPEGRQVCPSCETMSAEKPDAILEDGTLLYLKTHVPPNRFNLQLFLYDLLTKND